MKKINIVTGILFSVLLMGCGASKDTIEWQQEDTQTYAEESCVETQSQTFICVYVCGAVKEQGVYEVPEGSRLYEVIAQAGGMLDSADDMYLNLAREVRDGEQIVVLTSEQTKRADGSLMTEELRSSSTLVNINSASVEELTTISGIGESRAKAIIEYREQYGAFQTKESIMKVSGIKEALYAKIKDKITV